MTVDASPYLSKEELLSYLRTVLPKREVITASDLREFLNISQSTDQRMRLQGQYPRTVSLPGKLREKRILLIDFAAWLERGGCPPPEGPGPRKRGRGSEAWKRNHPPMEEEGCGAEA